MKNDVILILVSAVALILLINFFLSNIQPEKIEINLPNKTGKEISARNTVSLQVPAIDENGKGVATTLIVEVVPGKGRVLTDINHMLFFTDTQNSIQIAKSVAENITGVNITKIDLIYQIETNASAIGGPSAGAALTVATVAAIENKTLNPKVGITGTINSDGTIGPVGGVEEKAMASKEAGIETFLVPEGQGTETTYAPKRECRQIGPILYCTTEYSMKKVDISKDVGITVKEIANVDEALKYFLD
jgi:uncharacterized protein